MALIGRGYAPENGRILSFGSEQSFCIIAGFGGRIPTRKNFS
jgi:hypothetical protein